MYSLNTNKHNWSSYIRGVGLRRRRRGGNYWIVNSLADPERFGFELTPF